MSDEISRLLGTTNVELNSTSGTAVTAPTGMDWACKSIVMAAQLSDTMVQWRRGKTSAATATALCAASKESIEFKANPGQTIFYAKSLSGTPTLEIEFYG